jgi:uncharacterized protein YeaC (DUF1315 family)
MSTYDLEVEEFIRQAFVENFEMLRFEGGHSLTPEVKEAALQQVLLYWRKLYAIAEKVTETEAKLNLPEQKTPKGRKFGIEGVVDIVRENDQTVMYDIKSHEVAYVRANTEFYEKQLNVYAYIWQKLRHQPLDQTAIIATDFPEAIAQALTNGDQAQLEAALNEWDPVVEIPFDERHVETTIAEFGCVVDAIEERIFAPPPVEKLQTRLEGTNNILFATQVCRNCDARFSCASYRDYALESGQGSAERNFRRYFNDYGDDLELETWRTANLEVIQTIDVIEEFL